MAVGPTASWKHRMSLKSPRRSHCVQYTSHGLLLVCRHLGDNSIPRPGGQKDTALSQLHNYLGSYGSCLTVHVYIEWTACLSQFSSESGPRGNGSALHSKKSSARHRAERGAGQEQNKKQSWRFQDKILVDQ